MKKKIENNKKYLIIAVFILAIAGIVGIFATKPLGKNYTNYKVAQFTSTGATIDLVGGIAKNLDRHANVEELESNLFRIYLPDTGRQNSEIQDQIVNDLDLVSGLTVNSIYPANNPRLVTQVVFTLSVLIIFEIIYFISASNSFTRLSRFGLALSTLVAFIVIIFVSLGLSGLLATAGLYRIEPWSLVIVCTTGLAFYFISFIANIMFLNDAKSYKSESFVNEFKENSKSIEDFQIGAYLALTLLGVALFALTKTNFIFGTLLLCINFILVVVTIKEIYPRIVELLMSKLNTYKPLVKSRFWQRN